MNTPIRLVFAFCLSTFASLLAVSPALAQEYVAPPLSAYGELPGIEDAALSPSGERTAAIIKLQGKRILVALGPDLKPITTMNVDSFKVRGIRWIDEEHLLMTYGSTQDLGYGFTTDKAEFTTGIIVPMDNTKEAMTIFNDSDKLVNALRGSYGMREIDGRVYGYFGAIELKRVVGGGSRAKKYGFNHGRPYLYRVDMRTNKSERVAFSASEGRYASWEIDANGGVAATYTLHEQTGKWTIKNANGTVITDGRSRTGSSGMLGLGKDGTTLIYYFAQGEEASKTYEIPLAGGTPVEFMPDMDVARLYFDPRTNHLVGYREDEDSSSPVFDDPTRTAAVRKVNNAFKQMEDMRVLDWSHDFNNFLVRTTGVQDSGTWYTVDVENLSAKAIAYERIAVGPKQVGHFSTFEYTASDGLELDGILTLPPGQKEGKDLPLVMFPHGGPHSADRERFHWWAQAFASRGYAVFQPNFRGSTNRDRDFRRAGYGEWGRKMQTDVSDGLTALAEAGIVDPERVCIMGASYGGYAALAGVTLQQGIYRCAVAVAPVVDVARIYREDYRASGRNAVTKAVLLRQLGDPDTWNEVSPHRHAEKADAPVMLIHGKDDVVVPYVHSVKMADGLKDHDKVHEFVTLEGEDHWLSLPETRMQMLEASMRFIQKHNPAD